MNLHCTDYKCLHIPDPENGQILFAPDKVAPFDRATAAAYSCDPGFGLTSGDTVRTCDRMNETSAEGEWSGEEPSCDRTSFILLTNSHANVTLKKILFAKLGIVCSPLMEIPNGRLVLYDPVGTNDDTNYIFGTTATYICLPGYSLNDSATRICGGDGKSVIGSFSGTTPACEGWYIVLNGY